MIAIKFTAHSVFAGIVALINLTVNIYLLALNEIYKPFKKTLENAV